MGIDKCCLVSLQQEEILVTSRCWIQTEQILRGRMHAKGLYSFLKGSMLYFTIVLIAMYYMHRHSALVNIVF